MAPISWTAGDAPERDPQTYEIYGMPDQYLGFSDSDYHFALPIPAELSVLREYHFALGANLPSILLDGSRANLLQVVSPVLAGCLATFLQIPY